MKIVHFHKGFQNGAGDCGVVNTASQKEVPFAWRSCDHYIIIVCFFILTRVNEQIIDWNPAVELQWRLVEFGAALIMVYTGFKLVKHWYPEKLIIQPKFKCIPASGDNPSISTQTEIRNYKREIELAKKLHCHKRRSIQRSICSIKRKFALKLKESRETLLERTQCLTEVQFKLLPLTQHREAILSEKEALEKQMSEEKTRHADLLTRFNRVNHQMERNGQQHGHCQSPSNYFRQNQNGGQPYHNQPTNGQYYNFGNNWRS